MIAMIQNNVQMWSLYENSQFLKPLTFSSGKTQEDIVKEVLNTIEKGHKIIFIHGICGTGKSAIALNLANNLGKTSIVVPIKNLQEQYKKDYEKTKYLLKKTGEKLKISIITGRANHKCRFLEENKNAIPKREENSKLQDIFFEKRKRIEEEIQKNISADNQNIPCRIEIREQNWNRLKGYIQENKDVNIKNFNSIKEVKRASVAGACPFWCPAIPSKYELGGKSFLQAEKKRYIGLNDTEFIFYKRKPGCKFYEQFENYISSDVIVFNSEKYKLESWLSRKPKTEIEIIDECDEFLDNFANQKSLNLDRLQNSLIKVISTSDEMSNFVSELLEITKQIKKNQKIINTLHREDIIPLKETGIYDLIKISMKNKDFFYEMDEESYVLQLQETALMFNDFLEETYLTITKKEDNLIANLVTTNLAKRFKEMKDKNKVIVLMSGTIHSKEVLKNIFGLEKFKIIEAETQKQGQIEVLKTGSEIDCSYQNFSSSKISREEYLKTLDRCIQIAKKPCLVHVHAFADLPSREEIKKYKIENTISREELKQVQLEDKNGELIQRFKNKEIKILFSTRASRGMDFPGDQCNSIVFTKYPNPNVQDAFWKILQKTNPQNYWNFYKDKAERELLQKVYRGLRSKEDHVYVLSPDCRVLNYFEKNGETNFSSSII